METYFRLERLGTQTGLDTGDPELSPGSLLEPPWVSWEPGTPALSVLSESEFVVRVRESEIVVLVAEGSVTDEAEHMSLVFVLLAVI